MCTHTSTPPSFVKMFSCKFALLGSLVLALCASARPSGDDKTYNGQRPAYGWHGYGSTSLDTDTCTGDYSYVTETYSPIITYTETFLTTLAPSGQPTQLMARQDSSSPDSGEVPNTTTVTSTATHTVTDTTLLVRTATAVATSTVSVTSTTTASTATETSVMVVTSTITGTQAATTA
ncbi:hypothetical protein C8T65DRAFT_652830 [Cerioporus squamosus]|nr:hypothetical protein C8T65DRAFT_652830 [Cerioporus squamosus]